MSVSDNSEVTVTPEPEEPKSTEVTDTKEVTAPKEPAVEESGKKPKRILIKGEGNEYVKLNVGGSLFHTTIGTLTKQHSMLRAMFSGRMESLTDSDGYILIDRDGKHFSSILNYLRDGEVPLPDRKTELQELLREAKYYLLEPLIEVIEEQLDRFVAPPLTVCSVPLIQCKDSQEELTKEFSKVMPIVKLSCNRSNNKYSYTSNSSDNMLKNIELFETNAAKLQNQVLFIKDISTNHHEVCNWSFYAKGQHIYEVSCSAIAYYSDKKNMKIDFPEGKIYEGIVNALSFGQQEKVATTRYKDVVYLRIKPHEENRVVHHKSCDLDDDQLM